MRGQVYILEKIRRLNGTIVSSSIVDSNSFFTTVLGVGFITNGKGGILNSSKENEIDFYEIPDNLYLWEVRNYARKLNEQMG